MTTTKPDVQALIEEAEQFADGWKGNDFAVVWEPFDQPAKIRFWNDRDTAISDAENIQRNDDIKNWEAAHGHDVRLKCYPEFQCAAIELYAAYLVTRLTEALSALSGGAETVWEYRARFGRTVFGEPRIEEGAAVRSARDAMSEYPLVCDEPLILERRRDLDWEAVA